MNRQFVDSFTAHFDELCVKYPIYAELRNICDLALAASLVREEGLADKVGWHTGLLWRSAGIRSGKVPRADRRGRCAARHLPQGTADPFSPKSSRIVRAMLSGPAKGWKVRELADHVDVKVSPGLVVKIKRTLVQESYAVEREGLLILRDPVGLLENWARNYPGPAEQVPMYFLGDAGAAEEAVAGWCVANSLEFALAGFSAAWRLAPEVRYSVAAVYVEDRGFDPEVLGRLGKYKGGKRVETGANLLLWRPFDRSVLAGSRGKDATALPVTSAIQTYLDLKRLAGRGEEAAAAVFERLLAGPLRAAADQNREMSHDGLQSDQRQPRSPR